MDELFCASLPLEKFEKKNYSPVKGRILAELLGPTWYEDIYDNDEQPAGCLILNSVDYKPFVRNSEHQTVLKHNVRFWLSKQQTKPKRISLTVLAWHRLLQLSMDMQDPDLYNDVYSSIEWSGLDLIEQIFLRQIW